MKSLTIRQPWASAFFRDDMPKNIENRSWSTEYRGPVAILAGLKLDPSAADLAPVDLPRGGVVGSYLGVVDIVGCHRALPDCDCGPWAFTPEGDEPLYHWAVANPRRLTFAVNAAGHLGLRDIPEGPLNRILTQLGDTL